MTNVPILSEHNYPTWKIRIRGKLQWEKVWGTVSGEDPDPSALPAAGIISATPSSISTTSAFPDTWKIHNDKALGIIIEYVSNKKLNLITDETSAKGPWEKLEREHIATFVADSQKLTAMRKAISDEMQAFLVLTLLPSTPIWDMFITLLLQALPAASTLTFEAVST
ncbi:hypothetical protein BDR06DRAFT_899110 [Suillus hirtellus]|nr:hypothetical protein BDR06DRAFT_899110 [Suillus hirtellus]